MVINGDLMMVNYDEWWLRMTGWWYTYPSEKYEFVKWDDDIPNMMGKNNPNVPNHHLWLLVDFKYLSCDPSKTRSETAFFPAKCYF